MTVHHNHNVSPDIIGAWAYQGIFEKRLAKGVPLCEPLCSTLAYLLKQGLRWNFRSKPQ
jgi:hypothetical protein